MDPRNPNFDIDTGDNCGDLELGFFADDPYRSTSVSATNGSYTSIETALADIESWAPSISAANSGTLYVFPGTYIVNNPVVMPSGLGIIGVGTRFSVQFRPLNAGLALFELVMSITIEKIFITSAAIAMDCVASNISIVDCVFHACAVSIRGSNTSFVNAERVTIIDQPIGSVGIQVVPGGTVTARDCLILQIAPLAISVDVDDGTFYCFSTTFTICTYCIRARNGSTVIVSGCSGALVATIGLDVTGASSMVVLSTNIELATIDVNVDATSTFSAQGCQFDERKFVRTPTSLVTAQFLSSTEGEEGTNIIGHLHVGDVTNPSPSSFGSGHKSTRTMTTLTNTNLEIGVWADVTVILGSYSGSTVDAFPGVGAGNSLYIGSSNTVVFPAITTKTDLSISLGAGSLVWEYWNGAAWIKLYIMVTDTDAPHLTYSTDVFRAGGGILHDIRLHPTLGWATKTLNGTSSYWIRCRIVVAITTSPVLEQVSLHGSHSTFSSEGFPLYYGLAEPVGRLPWDISLAKPAAASPLDQDLFLSDNLDVGRTENRLVNGATDRVALAVQLPFDFDTSHPVTVVWQWVGSAAGVATVDWRVRWAISENDDQLYINTATAPVTAPGEQVIIEAIASPADAYKYKTTEFDLEIEAALPHQSASSFSGTVVWISVERTVGDAFAGDVSILNLTAFYKRWCGGGYKQ
jgi:hypothetical protein